MLVALMTRCLIAIQLALFPLLLSTGAPKTTLLLIVWLRQMTNAAAFRDLEIQRNNFCREKSRMEKLIRPHQLHVLKGRFLAAS